MSSLASWFEMSSPPTTIVPSVAERMPPAIEQSVVLPEPEGPDQRDDLVAAEGERGVVEGDDLGAVAHRVHLADVVELECRRHGSGVRWS